MSYKFVIEKPTEAIEGLFEVKFPTRLMAGLLMFEEGDRVIEGKIVHDNGNVLEKVTECVSDLKADEVILVCLLSSSIPNRNDKIAYILECGSDKGKSFLTELKECLSLENEEQVFDFTPVIIKGKVTNVSRSNNQFTKSALGAKVYFSSTTEAKEFNDAVKMLEGLDKPTVNVNPLI